MATELAASVVKRLVERAARGTEALGEDVDRHLVQRERDEDVALVRRQKLDPFLHGAQELALV